MPFDDEDLAAKGMIGMIEDALRIETLAIDASLKMQMIRGGAARTPFQADRFSRMQPLADLDKVLRMVAI